MSDALTKDEEVKKAKLKALSILTDRDKTEKELTDKLKNSGYSDGAAEAAVAYVKSYGYIDDEKYARSYAAYRQNTKSRLKIKTELLRRGVAPQTVSDVLSELYEDFDESSQIRAFAEKKLGGELPDCLPDRGDEKAWASLCRHLTAKGFSYESIRHALCQ